MAPDRKSQLSSIGLLVLAALSLPLALLLTALLKLWHRVAGPRAPPTVQTIGKTAIVTGGKMTKALMVCRQLKQSGCRVRPPRRPRAARRARAARARARASPPLRRRRG
jgi:hypothetical protein